MRTYIFTTIYLYAFAYTREKVFYEKLYAFIQSSSWIVKITSSQRTWNIGSLFFHGRSRQFSFCCKIQISNVTKSISRFNKLQKFFPPKNAANFHPKNKTTHRIKIRTHYLQNYITRSMDENKKPTSSANFQLSSRRKKPHDGTKKRRALE